MDELDELLERNRHWAESVKLGDPDFFRQLSQQQNPRYLWIGCSDSRVPANQILGLLPGEIFVHRNVANVVVHADLNCLSVLQFAIDVLKVEHIMLVGHYGCGGVRAVLDGARLGLVDNWLRHVGDVLQKHREVFTGIDTASMQHARLCELNVVEQVVNICQTTIVQDAWDRGQKLAVHGLVYSLFDGRLRDLGITTAQHGALTGAYVRALARLGAARTGY